MRDLLAKLTTGSMIAGAALLVAACGSQEEANVVETNVTEMNAMDDMNMATDNMTATDGAMGNDAMMANDMNAMGNMTDGNMMGNEAGNSAQ
jgi:outer membrane murein-binding lipoprotein Lpp